MSQQADRAEALFYSGANCAQSVLGAYAEQIGLSASQAARLASGFGGGLGRQRGLCGAVSGMCMAAGLLYGYESAQDDEGKLRTYQMVRLLCAQFQAKAGSMVCAELLGKTGQTETARAEKRTPAYYESRPCAGLCRLAAQLLADYRPGDEAGQ